MIVSDRQLVAVGVIGLGRIGRVHAENLALRIPGARVAAVVDQNEQTARELAEVLSISQVHLTVDALMHDPAIDAVVICSPTDTHADLIEQAAAAGKHIFCEKPIALDLAAIDRSLAAVAATGVQFQIGFQRRFDPSFRRLHQAVHDGEIGQLHLVKITSRDPQLPPLSYLQSSGGLFLDMTIHDFDMARFLVGDEITEVYAIGAARVDPAVTQQANDIDTSIVTLKFLGGALAVIDNSRQAVYGYDQRAEVFGSAGAMSVDNDTAYQVSHSDRKGIHAPLPCGSFMDRYRQAYAVEMQEFIDCVQHDKVPSATGHDGRVAVLIAQAANRSLREGRPVKLSELE